MRIIGFFIGACSLTIIISSLCYAHELDIVDVKDIVLPCSPDGEAQWDKTKGVKGIVVALVTRGMSRPAEGGILIRSWGNRVDFSTPRVEATCTPTEIKDGYESIFPILWPGDSKISPIMCAPGEGLSVIMPSPICMDPNDPNDPKACIYYGKLYRFRVSKNIFSKRRDLQHIREFLSERLEGLPGDIGYLAPSAPPCIE